MVKNLEYRRILSFLLLNCDPFSNRLNRWKILLLDSTLYVIQLNKMDVRYSWFSWLNLPFIIFHNILESSTNWPGIIFKFPTKSTNSIEFQVTDRFTYAFYLRNNITSEIFKFSSSQLVFDEWTHSWSSHNFREISL